MFLIGLIKSVMNINVFNFTVCPLEAICTLAANTQKSIRKAPKQTPALKLTCGGFAVYF